MCFRPAEVGVMMQKAPCEECGNMTVLGIKCKECGHINPKPESGENTAPPPISAPAVAANKPKAPGKPSSTTSSPNTSA